MVQSTKISRLATTALIGVGIGVVFGALVLGFTNPAYIGNIFRIIFGSSISLMLFYINRESVLICIYYNYFNIKNYLCSKDFRGLLISFAVFLVIVSCAYVNTDYIYCMDELTKNLEFAEKDYKIAYDRWHACVLEYRYPDFDVKNATPEQAARMKFLKQMIPRFDEAQADAEVRRIWAKWDIEAFQKAAAESSNSTTEASNSTNKK